LEGGGAGDEWFPGQNRDGGYYVLVAWTRRGARASTHQPREVRRNRNDEKAQSTTGGAGPGAGKSFNRMFERSHHRPSQRRGTDPRHDSRGLFPRHDNHPGAFPKMVRRDSRSLRESGRFQNTASCQLASKIFHCKEELPWRTGCGGVVFPGQNGRAMSAPLHEENLNVNRNS